MERSQIENAQRAAKGLQDEYNRSKAKKQKKKKLGGLWVWIIVLLIGALSNLESNTSVQRYIFMVRAWFYWVTRYWVPGSSSW